MRNHVTPYLGAVRVDKLTATRIAARYRERETSGREDQPGLGKPLAANTVSEVHVLLAAMLDAAVDDGLILLNPAKKKRTVNPPTSSQVRAQEPEIVTWTGHQLHAFLTWNRDDELFPLWRTIAYTGRISLRRAVDIAAPRTTKVTKTGSARVIDIDTETLDVLKAHKADRGAVSLDSTGHAPRSTACLASRSSDCGTPTPPCCWSWASIPRPSKSGSGTQRSPRR